MSSPGTGARLARQLRRLARWPLLLLVAAVILFEELAWDELARLLGRLAALPFVARLEARIARLSAPWAMTLFFAPYLTLLPLKILAVYLVAEGQGGKALLLILIAKIGGTALVARLFVLTQATLMTVPWFERVFLRYQRLKQQIVSALTESQLWRLILAVRRMRAPWREALARSWCRGRKIVRRWRTPRDRRL
ncbi:hypothetical protein [Paludibacterium yongneupense]|uniref:hypothetical protein n=1 Tax=Paludibacterium yongneupense TaxID=400061 RepID=UPI0004222301|nr:hypothetical protein [Paludibacterium yongneupense]